MSESPSVRRLMTEDHARMEAVFEELQQAVAAGVDVRTLGQLWTRFDRGLRAHLAAEEALLFPALVDAHPVEVAALLAEHEALRESLDELAVEVDLHVLRKATVDRLLERLRAHAAREDASVYPWAAAVQAEGAGRSLGARLAEWLTEAAVAR